MRRGLWVGITGRGDGSHHRCHSRDVAEFDDGRGNAVPNGGYQKVEPVLQGGRAVSRDTYFLDGSLVGSGTTTPTRINNRIYNPADGALRDYVGSRAAYNFATDHYFKTPMERYNILGAAQTEVEIGRALCRERVCK